MNDALCLRRNAGADGCCTFMPLPNALRAAFEQLYNAPVPSLTRDFVPRTPKVLLAYIPRIRLPCSSLRRGGSFTHALAAHVSVVYGLVLHCLALVSPGIQHSTVFVTRFWDAHLLVYATATLPVRFGLLPIQFPHHRLPCPSSLPRHSAACLSVFSFLLPAPLLWSPFTTLWKKETCRYLPSMTVP